MNECLLQEPWANDINTVKRYMNNYVADSSRRGDHVCLDNKEVCFSLMEMA